MAGRYFTGDMMKKAVITLGIEAGINFIISGFLNGLSAWLLYRTVQTVPVDFWSLFIDTTITCFLVSVCTAYFTTKSAGRYRTGGLYVTTTETWRRRLQALPEANLPMGCCLFGICLPVLLTVFGILFRLTETTALSVPEYVAFKGVWGGLYGAMVCVVILFRHLMIRGGDTECASVE